MSVIEVLLLIFLYIIPATISMLGAFFTTQDDVSCYIGFGIIPVLNYVAVHQVFCSNRIEIRWRSDEDID